MAATPRRILGVDISAFAIELAKASLAGTPVPQEVRVHFVLGSTVGRPVPDQSFDSARSSFQERSYINMLDIPTFRDLARDAGFHIARLKLHSFGSSAVRRVAGRALMRMPVVGEYSVSYSIIELLCPD